MSAYTRVDITATDASLASMYLEMSLLGIRTVVVSPQLMTALIKAWMWSLKRIMRLVYSKLQGAKLTCRAAAFSGYKSYYRQAALA